MIIIIRNEMHVCKISIDFDGQIIGGAMVSIKVKGCAKRGIVTKLLKKIYIYINCFYPEIFKKL